MVGAVTIVAALTTFACSSTTSAKEHNPNSPTPASASGGTKHAPYARRGPYPVGVTTLRLADGRRVVVWYPAGPHASEGHPRERVDLVGLLSPALQTKVPARDRLTDTADAFEDAPLARSRHGFPLVLFSHGLGGYPEQSLSLTTHLASWGFAVAAPDHVERSLDGLLGNAANGVPPETDTQVLQATIDGVERAASAPGLLRGSIDPAQVAVTGHSSGAAAAYELAGADPRVKAWIGYSIAFGAADDGTPQPPPPHQPGMVMTGTADGAQAPSATVAVYRSMRTPKYLVQIGGAGHLVFSDICLVGKGQGGAVAIARALQLPIPENLLKLGTDGCQLPHPPVQQAFPAIDQLSVSFLRWAFGIDHQPVGLSGRAVRGLGATVTVSHRG